LASTDDPRASRRIATRQRKKTEPERDHNNNLVSVATQTTPEKPEDNDSGSPPHIITGVPATRDGYYAGFTGTYIFRVTPRNQRASRYYILGTLILLLSSGLAPYLGYASQDAQKRI
jgi:hypothetical protein